MLNDDPHTCILLALVQEMVEIIQNLKRSDKSGRIVRFLYK